MSYSNRELVEFYISYKLSQRNYSSSLLRSKVARGRTNWDGDRRVPNNGPLVNRRAGSPRKPRGPPASVDVVKSVLKDAAEEFEHLYTQSFKHLSLQLDITPDTAYNSFKTVLDELFKGGFNWGRVVAMFTFGGILCVDCVQKNMSELVSRISEWMTTYLDEQLNPWIQSQGGWDRFVNLYGQDAAAEGRRFRETLNKWLLFGVAVLTGALTGVLLVALVTKKR